MIRYSKIINPTTIKNLFNYQHTYQNINSLALINKIQYYFAEKPKYNVIDNPKDVSKLVFDQNGKCLIFQHKNGQAQLKWVIRFSSFLTIVNTFLTGLQYAYPVFGMWNHFSFGMSTGLGFLLLSLLQIFTKRTVHKIHLQNNLQYVDLTFFNAFWKPRTITYHISQFQQPTNSYFGFIRFELTSLGKIWIKLQKNQFRNIKDYQQTLDCVLLGKPIVNLKIDKNKKTNKY